MAAIAPVAPQLSRKQVIAVGHAQQRVNIYEGAIRSGKTFSSILAWLAFVASAPLNGELIMIGKNKDSIYRNVFAPIENEPALAMVAAHVHYRQGSNTARILGRRVNVVGANDSKAESKIRGMTVAGAYIDEVTVIPVEFFKQMLGRMSVVGARMFGTTNPDSPAHWLKVEYLDKIGVADKNGYVQLQNWARFHFTIDDNPSLSDEYKESIRREYTGLWYRRFILGLWVSAEGAIYDMWDAAPFNPARPVDGGHVIAWKDLPRMVELYGVGIDYGTTNPTSAVLMGLGVDGRLYLIDEYRHETLDGELRLADPQLSKRLRDWLAENHLPYENRLKAQYIVLDPSAASFHVQLQLDGVHNVAPAENDVLYGIRTVSGLLSQKMLITSDRCRGWINEAPGYSWDPTAQLAGQDKPLKTADHSCDAVRYIVATTQRLWVSQLDMTLAA